MLIFIIALLNIINGEIGGKEPQIYKVYLPATFN